MADFSAINSSDNIRLFISKDTRGFIKGTILGKENGKILIDISGDAYYILDYDKVKVEYDPFTTNWYWRIELDNVKEVET